MKRGSKNPTINQEFLNDILKYLKRNKAAGNDYISNEFFINGAIQEFIYILTWFFNTNINTSYIPEYFSISLVTPIPKKGTMKSPTDYRPISVSSTLESILESILLSEMECLKNIHKHQFGSKKKLSSKHAYYLVNETWNHYRQNGSNVYILSLDACKAFDKL
ncbi:unnamed protein product [Brachionus calyciflorus]|uniref:Reverse transcriptase domain-containing protein n=1 Tax=Brachionus calyciflorus TaxID=104777 RepID=A0A814PRQ9_9BILA|nr:unnamed protein product [Brachionus calyciflorus]